MTRLIEIEKDTYASTAKIVYYTHNTKAVNVDGEIYTKISYEQCTFDTMAELQHYLDTNDNRCGWEKRAVDFSCFGHPIVYFWDSKFVCDSYRNVSAIIMDAFSVPTVVNYVNYYSLPYLMFNHTFFDFDNPIEKRQVYKTRPNSVYTVYNPTSKTIFDKSIISNIDYLVTGRDNGGNKEAVEELFYEKNCFRFIDWELGVSVDVAIEAVLNCNFAELKSAYKKTIEQFFIDDDNPTDDDLLWRRRQKPVFKMPKNILQKGYLTESEKTKIISEILIEKANYKRNKNIENEQRKKRENRLCAC